MCGPRGMDEPGSQLYARLTPTKQSPPTKNKQEGELFQGAEEALKATKDKMKAVYHDLSSISPDAQKLLQRCAEN